jgi:hypothetical protein
MTEANVAAIPLACVECSSLSVTKYQNLAKGGSRPVAQAWSDVLTDGDYLCPKCRTYNLHFGEIPGILFD